MWAEERHPADADEPDEEVEFEKPEERKHGEEILATVHNDPDMGYTEYALISLWLAFTVGIFGLLYRITNEADEEHKKKKEK